MHIDDFLVYRVEEVTSTQDLAKELIERGDGSHGRVVISDSQTSGRGRYGREWISKTGNAYFTMLLNSKGSDEQICYIAGLALFDVLKQHITSHKIQLKWVNDILIDGKKIAGILLEKFDRFVLVGVGVNLIYDAVLEMMGATSIDQFVVGITRDIINGMIMDL
jgi:BirA family biotin operon repressor/biotin-[acetyl-CoA-carboxylase] ligase